MSQLLLLPIYMFYMCTSKCATYYVKERHVARKAWDIERVLPTW